ncbi:MAG: hypothetical protein M3041_10025 [Acidobacteriota bacterium]|nr:hypothetical protein [Acidobacteriota bacterium]
MRYLAILILAAGCATTQSIPSRIDWPIVAYPLSEQILERADVTLAFEDLLRKSSYGRLGEERAGFLVLDGDHFRLVLWPPTHKYHAEEWRGKIPEGTVAAVHTHPIGHPEASNVDRAESQRVGIPMFVITLRSVVLVTDDGRTRHFDRDDRTGVSTLHILARR